MRASEIRDRLARILSEHAPAHLVHVGAHDGEEVTGYLNAGVPQVTLVEPLPHLAARLRDRYADDRRVTVIEAACSDRDGTAVLHVPAKTNMASLVPIDGEAFEVRTVRLDVLCPDADAAVVDVQGHEFEVLAAAPWDSLRLVMVETLHGVDDPGLSPPYDRMVDFMAGRGFVEAERLVRAYDWIQKWAYRRRTRTGAEVRDVVFIRR